MSNPARSERHALCDAFLELGPDAPTLCAGWTTRDLAAHLVVRETRPDAAGGILFARLAKYGDRVRDTVARTDWTRLVDRVRSGPPRLSPMRFPAVDRLTNTLEYFVHLEDVRRAQPDWVPRELSADLEDALLGALERGAKLMGRRSPCGLTMTPRGGISFVAKKGHPVVDVSGPIGELVLFIYGRRTAARVEVNGPDDAVAAVEATRFGV
jgi:uncharacterized protein (TIGR03085 family)